ncbi:MAG: response regulator [Planctomycetota bacterium]
MSSRPQPEPTAPRKPALAVRLDRALRRLAAVQLVVAAIVAPVVFVGDAGAMTPIYAAGVLAAQVAAGYATWLSRRALVVEARRASRDRSGADVPVAAPRRRRLRLDGEAADRQREKRQRRRAAVQELARELADSVDARGALEHAARGLVDAFEAAAVEVEAPSGDVTSVDTPIPGELCSIVTAKIPGRGRDGRIEVAVADDGDDPDVGLDDLEDVGLLLGVTLERIQLQRALRRARARADASGVARAEFLANTSHEIRTPMNGILGSAEMLADTTLDDTQRESVQTIAQCTEDLLALLDDVLLVSALESGRVEVDHEAFDVAAVLNDVVEQAVPTSGGLELITRCDHALDGDVLGDERHVRRALSHLISNAIKFTDEGSITVSAELLGRGRAGDTSRRIRFAVQDTGIGVPTQLRDAIFDTFTQGDGAPTRRHSGAGLGLSIANELVTLMGSTMELESEVGTGSTFSFVLELDAAGASQAQRDERAAASSAAVGDGTTPGAGLRVLVVDDNPINVRVARRLLEHRGAIVDEAKNGLEAVASAADGRHDVVLMDLQMPLMDGVEATRQLIRTWATEGREPVPIIALTAHAMDQHRDECRAAGMAGFLTKPLRDADLDDALDGLRADHRVARPGAA